MRDPRFERPSSPVNSRCPEFINCPNCHDRIRVVTADGRRRALIASEHDVFYVDIVGDGLIDAFVKKCYKGAS